MGILNFGFGLPCVLPYQCQGSVHIIHFKAEIIRAFFRQILPAELLHQTSVLDDAVMGGNFAKLSQNMRTDEERFSLFVQTQD